MKIVIKYTFLLYYELFILNGAICKIETPVMRAKYCIMVHRNLSVRFLSDCCNSNAPDLFLTTHTYDYYVIICGKLFQPQTHDADLLRVGMADTVRGRFICLRPGYLCLLRL